MMNILTLLSSQLRNVPRLKVSGREVPGGRDTQQRDGDLVDENATIPMET